jgi:hypothetical protein
MTVAIRKRANQRGHAPIWTQMASSDANALKINRFWSAARAKTIKWDAQ